MPSSIYGLKTPLPNADRNVSPPSYVPPMPAFHEGQRVTVALKEGRQARFRLGDEAGEKQLGPVVKTGDVLTISDGSLIEKQWRYFVQTETGDSGWIKETIPSTSIISCSQVPTQMPTVTEAHSYCTRKTKDSGSNFYYSFLFLPRPRREAIYTVYTLCHELDAAVDHPPHGVDPCNQLAQWRREIEAAYQGIPQYPVTISLGGPRPQAGHTRDYFQELIAGMEMDLTIRRYATFKDLYPYCYRVASIVGLICLKVFGTLDPRAQDYAINLGMAFQLTNIIRDAWSRCRT